ncbi:hypothetical protein FE257_002607 [Aspergillus nanangensis]|uniref:RNase MRP protein 1 RNA binding domain-containing protein n=1 Tax=Aspergillus nanangensis TaxID=2582783 RepID=A0AAD4CT30_ASPNN|nr:hypothetical protein FE257_002607 [Aspergillus nanangensis]
MDADKLFLVHSMLQLIFHRNKNQHGKSKWWKWLSILKRTTLKLANSLEYGEPGPSAHVYRGYLATQVVPKCYLAFSTVVADGQFSTLGTVLLATLSRLAKVTRIDRELKARQTQRPRAQIPARGTPKGEDVGEVLSRPIESTSKEVMNPSGARASHGSSKSRQGVGEVGLKKKKENSSVDSRNPKKKRRKVDAIDDLFDGLL